MNFLEKVCSIISIFILLIANQSYGQEESGPPFAMVICNEELRNVDFTTKSDFGHKNNVQTKKIYESEISEDSTTNITYMYNNGTLPQKIVCYVSDDRYELIAKPTFTSIGDEKHFSGCKTVRNTNIKINFNGTMLVDGTLKDEECKEFYTKHSILLIRNEKGEHRLSLDKFYYTHEHDHLYGTTLTRLWTQEF